MTVYFKPSRCSLAIVLERAGSVVVGLCPPDLPRTHARLAPGAIDLLKVANAKLSSTYGVGYASQCIDGITNNMCHSKKERAWLRLDLGQQQSIASVKIWNRQDCCQERFGAHVVEASNNGTNFTTCGAYTLPSGPGPYTEPCIATARYVRLRMTKRSACSNDACVLNLAEVQVLARYFHTCAAQCITAYKGDCAGYDTRVLWSASSTKGCRLYKLKSGKGITLSDLDDSYGECYKVVSSNTANAWTWLDARMLKTKGGSHV